MEVVLAFGDMMPKTLPGPDRHQLSAKTVVLRARKRPVMMALCGMVRNEVPRDGTGYCPVPTGQVEIWFQVNIEAEVMTCVFEKISETLGPPPAKQCAKVAWRSKKGAGSAD